MHALSQVDSVRREAYQFPCSNNVLGLLLPWCLHLTVSWNEVCGLLETEVAIEREVVYFPKKCANDIHYYKLKGAEKTNLGMQKVFYIPPSLRPWERLGRGHCCRCNVTMGYVGCLKGSFFHRACVDETELSSALYLTLMGSQVSGRQPVQTQWRHAAHTVTIHQIISL